MPLFGSRREPSPPPEPVHEEPRKHGLFHKSSPSPTGRSSVSSGEQHYPRKSSTSSSGGGFLHRGFGHNSHDLDHDASFIEARQRVASAEAAEREADRALAEARASVREAREHVKRLELEAKEDARLAKLKQSKAREMSKAGRALGRHGV